MKWGSFFMLLFLVSVPRPVVGDIVGEAAPEFSMKDVNGNLVTLSSLSDQTLMLFHFNTYCHTCRLEVPTINKIKQNYPDMNVIGIAIGNDQKEVETFRKNFKADYTIIPDPEQHRRKHIRDEDGEHAQAVRHHAARGDSEILPGTQVRHPWRPRAPQGA